MEVGIIEQLKASEFREPVAIYEKYSYATNESIALSHYLTRYANGKVYKQTMNRR